MGTEPKSGMARGWLTHRRGARYFVVLGSTIVTCVLISTTQFDPSVLWVQLKSKVIPAPIFSNSRVPLAVPIGAVQPLPTGTDSSVSKTPAALVLTSTRPGRNAREGYALMGVSVHSPQTYSAGALLANGARLQEIYKDSVVLERAGQSVRLYVAGKEPVGYQPTPSAMLLIGGVVSPEVAQPDSRDQLTNVIRVSPAFNGQSFAGLTVLPNPKSDAFFKLGLQDADIITAIDGSPLTDQKSAIAALRPLVKGQALTVIVKRGDQVQTIALNGSNMF